MAGVSSARKCPDLEGGCGHLIKKRAAYCANRGLRAIAARLCNHIHPTQSEQRCGSEEVAVVGVDFGETMFRSASEMQGVRGADVGGGGSGGEDILETFHHLLGQRQKVDEELLAIILELLRKTGQVFLRIRPFAAFAQENRGDFGTPVPSDGNRLVGLSEKSFDRFVTRFHGIDPEQISAVKVEHLRGRTGLRKS